MKDFTPKVYVMLLEALQKEGFCFRLFESFGSSPENKVLFLRHDVDRKPDKSFVLARIEADLGIKTTYYFRTVPESLNEIIISKIQALGHEIGYHYENLSSVAKRVGLSNRDLRVVNLAFRECLENKMNRSNSKTIDVRSFENFFVGFSNDIKLIANKLLSEGIKDFDINLKKLKEFAQIESIAMHGKPSIPIDNRLLWLRYDYRDYGIKCEPYFDFDFDEVLYITDAGRSWDNNKFNQMDKVNSRFAFAYKSTYGIIEMIEKNELPGVVIINVHPEHWCDGGFEWWKVLVVRKLKNFVKRVVLR